MQIIQTQFHYHNLVLGQTIPSINANFIATLQTTLMGINFVTPPTAIQKILSDKIILAFKKPPINLSTLANDIRCHPEFQFKYDGLIKHDKTNIGVEVQFRPDFLKDITRFQIGFNAQRINAMIYIVAIDKTTINPNYTTMPQYDLINNQLAAFTWLNVPIIVLGINCM